jgi:Holliday junction resolvase RusA-like endonuclease
VNAPWVADLSPELVIVNVDGPPVAKGRGRITTKGKFARIFTPEKTRAYEDQVRCAAAKVMQDRTPVLDAVTLTVTAFVAMPKGFSRKKRQDAIDGVLKPVTRPDADNYAKAALDGCNGILFKDDSQVADLIVRKRYSASPRLVIVMEFDGDQHGSN